MTPATVDILRCPISSAELHWLSGREIEELNERIRGGSLRHVDGTTVERPLTVALASDDGEFVYRVEDDIFFLLRTTALRGGPAVTAVTGCDLAPETKGVRQFYDEFGWRKSGRGVFEDALRYEDLRPVSRNYIRKCHLRIAKYLPSRGTYFLDVACGPIQYPEYVTYSAGYDLRICADVSEVALRHARTKLGEKGVYVLCDVTNLPLKDGVADGFVSLHTIYHVPAMLQRKAIDELYRVLKPHGSGVVVYSWGNWSPLMNALRLNDGEVKPPYLFGHSHDFAWYYRNVERRYRTRLASWRSVSVPFLQRFVHEGALGRPLLALLYWLESLFPRWFGRHGQYPVFVFTKETRRPRRTRSSAAL